MYDDMSFPYGSVETVAVEYSANIDSFDLCPQPSNNAMRTEVQY
jgi:hypothetical protein